MARPKKPVKDENIKLKIIEDMKGLGVYKKEYDLNIEILSDLIFHYEITLEKYKKSNYQCVSFTAAGGEKKSSIVATLETLRKDIATYSTNLGLNPKGLESITTENKSKSKLADILGSLE
ncbi:hypothetical protein HMPREF9630_00566 [Peptoanaerobacter stomatis]|uniref:Phage terminase, small subunit, P27 family n=1 Tax=Peptoanaerobacter stomatis TaxID=796937 RepID=V9HQ01_9FIRM|nr:P27 family phage terminase small subunit [Peptoanaerobacter stomatis]EHL17399.1 hypothetical protein HMPREF9630_00566 [Peptoanaerobacter stomatis]